MAESIPQASSSEMTQEEVLSRLGEIISDKSVFHIFQIVINQIRENSDGTRRGQPVSFEMEGSLESYSSEWVTMYTTRGKVKYKTTDIKNIA